MKRMFAVGVVVMSAFVGVNALRAQDGPAIAVVRDPGCGCCLGWVAHLKRAGFRTTVTESADRIKNTPTIPADARSCHTGTVAGYLIEGHVPVEDIKRLLKERPANIVGLAAPGMPAGSPGMETPSGTVTPYNVVAIDKSGKTSVYAHHQ